MYDEDIESIFLSILRLEQQKECECFEIDKKINELIKIREQKSKPYDDKIKIKEKLLKDITLNECKTLECNYGKVTFRKGYDRISWDRKKLEVLSIKNPEIIKCRKLKFVKPNVFIKYY
jgi:hypothetical protein